MAKIPTYPPKWPSANPWPPIQSKYPRPTSPPPPPPKPKIILIKISK